MNSMKIGVLMILVILLFTSPSSGQNQVSLRKAKKSGKVINRELNLDEVFEIRFLVDKRKLKGYLTVVNDLLYLDTLFISPDQIKYFKGMYCPEQKKKNIGKALLATGGLTTTFTTIRAINLVGPFLPYLILAPFYGNIELSLVLLTLIPGPVMPDIGGHWVKGKGKFRTSRWEVIIEPTVQD